MRQLRFVKQGDDGNHLILETADGGEQFVLLIDAAVRDAARSDLPRLHPSAPEPEPAIGPREIQVRVRAGESPQKLAEDNKMALDRVLRFAAPVLDERARMAAEARRARARRGTPEGQTVIFGETVDARFGAHGIDPSGLRWDSRRREDGQWIVTATWFGGEADHSAEWLFHVSARTVTPLDDTAADLLSDRPIRPVVTRDPQRANLASAPPLAPGVVAFPAMPDARTGPLPALEDVFDQTAFDRGRFDHPPHGGSVRPVRSASPESTRPSEPSRPSAAVTVAQAAEPAPVPLRLADPGVGGTGVTGGTGGIGSVSLDAPVPVRSSTATQTAPLPRLKNLGIAHRDDETDEQRAERAHVPSWDDILMGVRRKGD